MATVTRELVYPLIFWAFLVLKVAYSPHSQAISRRQSTENTSLWPIRVISVLDYNKINPFEQEMGKASLVNHTSSVHNYNSYPKKKSVWIILFNALL